MRIAPCLLVAAALLAGCTSTVGGSPEVPPVVGTLLSGSRVDVTLVSFVDPAPTDEQPRDDERLVAAQFRIHNTSDRDYLVDPTTEVDLLADGKQVQDSFAETAAGAMLDQVSLAPDQTVLGYLTFTVPKTARATEVHYEPMGESPLVWQVGPGGEPTPAAPWPDARKRAHPLGELVTITHEGHQLIVTVPKVTDPATPQSGVTAGTGQHVVQVDFVVTDNTGQPADDPDLRIVTLFDAADQQVRADINSTTTSVNRPLTPTGRTTWPVQFVVRDTFKPDHVSFRPEFGETTTTIWALS